ncbi:MAG: ABC transporter ATP-binding protein [Alkalibacterium sp.]|nr:ABC transporter ATP-binding protein [Alkalibacterium sp.]
MAILEISNLSKAFGNQTVLKDVTFSVEEGSVFGFIGRNEAGKTTTMTIALGLLKADGGSITVNGKTVQYGDTETNNYVGYLPDVPEFYPFLTAREYMELSAEISGIEKKESTEKITELLVMVGLEDNKKRIKNYSRGMKQRLGIAQALINDPLLLICDEPTSALDPIGRQQLLSILKKVKEKTTVIFSTHILSDVESVCDEVAILNDGRIVKQGTVNQLKAGLASEKWMVVCEEEEHGRLLLEAISTDDAFHDVTLNGPVVNGESTDGRDAMEKLLAHLNALSITPVRIERKEATMEEVFVEAIK